MFKASENFVSKVAAKQPSHGAEAVPWALIIQAVLPIIMNCFNAPQTVSEARDSIKSPMGRSACRRCVRKAEKEVGRKFKRSEREEFLDQLRESLDDVDENEYADVLQELTIE